MIRKIKIRGDNVANWKDANPVLQEREIACETDSGFIKIGDGETAYNDLNYAAQYPLTKQAFEALAELNRRKYAGSGFVEWGSNHANAALNINQGMFVRYLDDGNDIPNIISLARLEVSGIYGISKTVEPIVNVNGYLLKLYNTQNLIGYGINNILLPSPPSSPDQLYQQILIFAEVWHEDVSEKDVVFPYGNVQYGATSYTAPDGTSLSTSLITDL